MSLEPIGIFTLVLGVYCLFAGYHASIVVFIGLSVFGAAAAILMGSANIQPAHLFLAFLALGVLTYRDKFSIALKALSFPKPGFWLACLLIYGTVLGFFAPRLLARMTDIIPLGSSEYPSTGSTVPLGPVSSNFTQAVYVSADLLAYVLILAIGATMAGFRAIAVGVLVFAGANAFFALLDIATYGTGAQDLFLYIRNAQYTFHDDDVVAGVKRIVGSWPEASAFAGISLAAVGFTGTLWLCGRDLRCSGALFPCHDPAGDTVNVVGGPVGFAALLRDLVYHRLLPLWRAVRNPQQLGDRAVCTAADLSHRIGDCPQRDAFPAALRLF
jgi:hypothetical protein